MCFLSVFTLGNVIDEPEHEKDEKDEHPLGEEADGRVVGEFGFHSINLLGVKTIC